MDYNSLIDATAKNNSLYLFFKENSFFNGKNIKIEKTPWGSKESDNSLSFKGACLKQIFNLKDSFCGKHAQAIGGSGNEGRKIMTLHSSSLAALLCFYNLSPKNKLTIPLIPNVEFVESEFEKKNPTEKFTSNIDVTLYSDDNKAVCFLESKFSEYLACGKKDNVSAEAYKEIYDAILSQPGLGDKLQYKNECLSSREKSNHYCEGIKQMVSHYMGAVEYAKREENQGKHVYLGEILFKFENPSIDTKVRGNKKNHFEDYTELYSLLFDAINRIGDELKPKNLHLLERVITYQEVFHSVSFLDKEVKSFYKL